MLPENLNRDDDRFPRPTRFSCIEVPPEVQAGTIPHPTAVFRGGVKTHVSQESLASVRFEPARFPPKEPPGCFGKRGRFLD